MLGVVPFIATVAIVPWNERRETAMVSVSIVAQGSSIFFSKTIFQVNHIDRRGRLHVVDQCLLAVAGDHQIIGV